MKDIKKLKGKVVELVIVLCINIAIIYYLLSLI
jgi:hypothetical protein